MFGLVSKEAGTPKCEDENCYMYSWTFFLFKNIAEKWHGGQSVY